MAILQFYMPQEFQGLKGHGHIFGLKKSVIEVPFYLVQKGQLAALFKRGIETKKNSRGNCRKAFSFWQNNEPIHRTDKMMDALKNLAFEYIDHPHYSPDLANFCFQTFKRV